MLQEDFINKIKRTLFKKCEIKEGSNICIGLSGGPDSVCLLDVLHRISKELNLMLYAVHINHMLRVEAIEDEKCVYELCRERNIPLEIFKIDVMKEAKNSKISIEEAGRNIRYSLFKDVANKRGCNYIAVAHHFDDQAETVLMNIIRGTGILGICGMDYKNDTIIRPLLDMRKDQIISYCNKQRLAYVEDLSNKSLDYTRNKVRNVLIPTINNSFKVDIAENIFKMSDIARSENAYLEKHTQMIYNNIVRSTDLKRICVDKDEFYKLDDVLKRRITRRIYTQLNGTNKGLAYKHVEDTLALIDKNETGKSISLPNDIVVKIDYKEILFLIKEDKENIKFCYNISIPEILTVNEIGIRIETKVISMAEYQKDYIGQKTSETKNTQCFDYDLLKEGINIRNRLNGDKILPYRAPGYKKLKDYFIDIKVPREKRDSIPLVCKGHDIIWILGYRTGDKYRVKSDSKSILVMQYENIDDIIK